MVEVVIYVAIVTTVFAIAVNMLLLSAQAFGKARTQRGVNEEGILAAERIIREVRLAHDINLSQSVFDVHPGSLTLLTLQSPSDSATTTRRFYVDGPAIMLREGSSPAFALTSANIRLTNLVFRNIAAALSKAVRVELTLEGGSGNSITSQKFYGTATLRRNY